MGKVWNLISKPGAFEGAIQARIEQLQTQEMVAQADCDELERALDEINLERQKVITWARKEMITEEDLETQLLALSWNGNTLRRELVDKQLLTGNRAERLIYLAEVFRNNFTVGWEEINSKPNTEELTAKQFKFKKGIFQALVRKVEIHTDRTVTVHAEVNLDE